MSIPYLPLYVADYELDTSHLTPEQDGIYTRLLRLCWRTPGCSIPDDPEWIALRMRVSPEYFEERVQPIITEFFRRRRGRIFNERLQRENERIKSTSEKRSSAGKKGGRPRKALPDNEKAESPAKANQKHLNLDPEPDLRTEAKASVPAKRLKRTRSAIPQDAVISEKQRDIFREMKPDLSDREAEAQFERMKDRAIAKGETYANLDAAWRNWLRSQYFSVILPNLLSFPGGNDGRRSREDRASERLDRALDIAARS